jgi:uncharacterized protein YkwD
MNRLLGLALLGISFLMLGSDKQEPPRLQLSKEEQTLLELTNKEREKEKLSPLEPNLLLFQAARGHSANMVKQGKMEHILDGKGPAQRVEALGYDYKRVGENVAWGEDGVTLETIMKGWMDSEGHRKNILNPDYAEIGLGIARDAKGEVYFTQVFGTQRKK